jgi:hypothetical protein
MIVILRSEAPKDLLAKLAEAYLESRTLFACAPAPPGARIGSEHIARATPYETLDLRAQRVDPSLRSG